MNANTTTEFGPIVGFALITADEAIEFTTEVEAAEFASIFGGFIAPIIATSFEVAA